MTMKRRVGMDMNRMTSSLAPALVWAVALMALIAGCGPANPLGRKALAGTVTLDGKPLERGAIELSKEWRTDKILRHLEALLVVADEKTSFLLSGNGDVISPDDGVLAIGSGGSYALAAARALVANTQLSAREIALEAMRIAGDICIYSNSNIIVEEL